MKTPQLFFIKLTCLIGFLAFLSLNSCDDPSGKDIIPDDDSLSGKFIIPNLSMINYPRVDGSTSTEPLQVLIASRLFDVEYTWIYFSPIWGPWAEYPYHLMPSSNVKPEIGKFIFNNIHHWGTHTSFERLIEKNTDLILVARSASADEKHLADSLDVTLIETPVAIDAFIFLENINNPVNSLTTKQIQDIYTGNITRWNEVGGSDTKIQAFMRDRNSGSQELMELMIMKDLTMINLPDMIVEGMLGLVNRIEYEKEGLGYSVYYYTQYMIRSDSIKILAVDGIYPEQSTIKRRKYGYTADVYAVIREDLDTLSTAYKLYKLLLTPAGQSLINESGYIPYY